LGYGDFQPKNGETMWNMCEKTGEEVPQVIVIHLKSYAIVG
jgi:hypothetical protein